MALRPANFEVKHVDSTADAIIFSVHFNNIESDPSSTIIVNVYKQHILEENKTDREKLEKVGNLILKQPFKELYTLEDLASNTNYRLNFFLTIKNDTYSAILFANTLSDPTKRAVKIKKAVLEAEIKKAEKNQLSVTENLLYTYTYMKDANLGIFDDKKDLKKHVLDARHSQKWRDYQQSGYKFARPKSNRDIRRKRMWLVANGMEVFEDVYGLVNQEKGFRILEGDWFMGPFYSYNHNLERKDLDNI
jgi:hypothetical protein